MPYTIAPGDTLWAIAQRFGITVQALLAANPGVDPARLRVGQQITVPTAAQPGATTYTVRPGDTFWGIATRFGISVQALAAANPQVQNPAAIYPGLVLTIPRPAARVYVVQPGDTLWAIARKLGVSLAALQQANPGVNPNMLMAGQRLTVPAAAAPAPTPAPPTGPIVVPRENYGYPEMMADLDRLVARYPFIQRGSIGESVLGREIPVVRIGTGPKEVHYNASFHGEEWITTPLLMKFLETYADAYTRGQRIGQYDIPTLYRQTSLWIVPMVNPDGVELQQNGIAPTNPYYDLVVRANGGSTNFRNWAANIRGVDLNNQFPANWEQEARRGPSGPAPRNYAGTAPLTEPESQAMAQFTREHDFRLVIAFHSQGEVIYWGYQGFEPPETERIAQIFAEASGYRPVRYAASSAGYKDWFEQEWRRPGFTVEVGLGTNPLPIGQFWEIWGENIGIMLAGLAV